MVADTALVGDLVVTGGVGTPIIVSVSIFVGVVVMVVWSETHIFRTSPSWLVRV